MKATGKKPTSKTILLSFDIEEFDMPFEYGKTISFDEQISVSTEGTKIILKILAKHQIKATFFCTVNFASHAIDLIHRIIDEGHELASHGYYHSQFKNEDLLQSKLELERISGETVRGFRMARMMPVENKAIKDAGYVYNSSLNPVYLPGRYNNFFKPRTLFYNELLQIPASATPIVRFPLFWLSFHNFPQWLYRIACTQTINTDHYLNIYFHPWEFTDLSQAKYGFPKYVARNSGIQMTDRFNSWVSWLKHKEYLFDTMSNYAELYSVSRF